jgi:hypothetical protein
MVLNIPSCNPDYSNHFVWTCFLANLLLEQHQSVTVFSYWAFCATSAFIVNADSAKCIEHSTEYCRGINSGRCLRTKAVHLFSLSLSFMGKRCTETPSVCWLFVQLFPFGHPATQYCPPRSFFAEAKSCVLAVTTPNWLTFKKIFSFYHCRASELQFDEFVLYYLRGD